MRKRDDPIDSTEPAVPHGEQGAPDSAPDSVPDGGPQSVYGRWSRRKARARAAPATPRADLPVPGLPVSGSPVQAPTRTASADPGQHAVDTPRERVLTDADMPALEALGEDDDYSGFLSPGVSEQLRLKALRKLFTGSKFNVTDGLDDYADDFTSFEPLGDIITSDMRHRIEVEAERARQAAEEESRERLAHDAAAQPAAPEHDADRTHESERVTASEPGEGGDSLDDDVPVALDGQEPAHAPQPVPERAGPTHTAAVPSPRPMRDDG